MLVMFPVISVADTKLIYDYNFVGPLSIYISNKSNNKRKT